MRKPTLWSNISYIFCFVSFPIFFYSCFPSLFSSPLPFTISLCYPCSLMLLHSSSSASLTAVQGQISVLVPVRHRHSNCMLKPNQLMLIKEAGYGHLFTQNTKLIWITRWNDSHLLNWKISFCPPCFNLGRGRGTLQMLEWRAEWQAWGKIGASLSVSNTFLNKCRELYNIQTGAKQVGKEE